MKKKTVFVGIDVSKITLDWCIINGTECEFHCIKNSKSSIGKLLKGLNQETTVIAMEDTGRYNWVIYSILEELDFEVHVLNPLHLKRSMGLVRGKTDKDDSYRIAHYISKYHNDLSPWTPDLKIVSQMKILLTERRRLMKEKTSGTLAIKELSNVAKSGFKSSIINRHKRHQKAIMKLINEVEVQMDALVASDAELSQKSSYAQSVPGIGRVLSWNLLAKTNGFRKGQNPRKLACFSGVVPFQKQSGSSLLRKPKVSVMADKQMKSLLHLAALVAIRSDSEITKYYQRKIEEGKNKMSVINAVRNKLVHRICAVINQEKYYEKDYVLT